MSALAFAALARSAQQSPGTGALFVDMQYEVFSDDVVVVQSTGFSQQGIGSAYYIADSLATAQLVAEHPRCAFTDAGGRHFRLFGSEGAVTVEQGGARAVAGIDDRAAIQAVIDYAAEVAITVIEFEQLRYELWTPLRTSPANDQNATDGHCLVVRKTLTLRGRAGQRATLECLSLTGRGQEDEWQDVGGEVWRGNGIFVLGDLGATAPAQLAIDRIALDRLIIRGNAGNTGNYAWPANPLTGDGWDVTHRGFRIQDSHVGDVLLTDTDFIGWKGEMFYSVGYPSRSVRAERCTMVTGNANAWNVQSYCPTTVVGCEFGDCAQAAEALSQGAAIYRDTVFRDCERVWIAGGMDRANGYHHRWTTRTDNATSARCRIDNCEFRNVDFVRIGSYVHGDFLALDSSVQLDAQDYYNLEDVSLRIESWLDQKSLMPPVEISGPASLALPAPSCPPGTLVQPIRNVHVTLTSHRTRVASSNDRHFLAPSWNGHVEANCSLVIDHAELATDQPPKSYDNPPLSFPMVDMRTTRTTQDFGAFTALWSGHITASGLFTPRAVHSLVAVASEVTYDLHLPTAPSAGSSYGYAEGQLLRIYKGGDTGALRFVRDGHASFVVRATRVLDNNADWIEFRWNRFANRWEEFRFWSSAAA